MPAQTPPLLADLQALLDHAGERGLPLTKTGRLRVADVRAINARFVAPAALDTEIGSRVFALRREDEAWRVHFVRLAGQAAGLLDARLGRLRAAARAARFRRLGADAALRELFVGWWWKGAWDVLGGEGILELRLARDRARTAETLLALGTAERAMADVGRHVRETLAPSLGSSAHLVLDDEAWGYAAWHMCLRALAAFDGAVETRAVREVNGHRFEHLSALRLTERGAALLGAALESRPAAPPRVRRGMRGTPRRSASRERDLEADTRWAAIRAEHPEYGAAIERGEERVGEVSPRAHLALHAAVEDQLAANEPPEARAAFERLVALGHDAHDVRHALAEELARELWAAGTDGRAFDNVAYAARLRAMPEPGEPETLAPARLSRRHRERLRRLPRAPRAWEGDLVELPIEVERVGVPLCALWADATSGLVRVFYPEFDKEPGALALASFVRAALRPQAGRAELPARVRVHPEVATLLRGALADLGVVVETAEELPAVHAAVDSFERFLSDPRFPPPGAHPLPK